MATVVKATLKLDTVQARKDARAVGKELEDAFRKALNRIKRSDKDFLGLIKALRETNKSIAQLRLEQQKLERSQLATTRAIIATSKAEEAYKRSLQQSRAAVARANTAEERLAQSRQQTRGITARAEIAEEKLRQAKLRSVAANKRLEQATKRASDARKIFTAEGLKSAVATRLQYGLAGQLFEAFNLLKDAIIDTAKANIEYESALTGVLKTSEGLHTVLADGSVQLTEFGESVEANLVALSRDIPVAINELLKIGEIGGQLGVGADQLETFTRVMAELEATTNIAGESGAISIGKLTTVLGLSNEELLQFSDSLVFLGNNAATTEADILKFSQRIAGTAVAVGLAESDLLSIASAFLSVGGTSSSSATAVQKALFAMQSASEGIDTTNMEAANDQLLLFAELASAASEASGEGALNAGQFAEIVRQDPGQAFLLFVEGLNASGKNLSDTLTELELADARLIRSFAALTGAVGTVNPEISLLREQMMGSAQAFEEGSARSEEFGLRAETTASKIELLKNAWTELQLAVGDTEFIKNAIEGITATTQSYADQITTIDDVKRAREELASVATEDDFEITQLRTRTGDLGIQSNVSTIGIETSQIENTRQYQEALRGVREETGTLLGTTEDMEVELAVLLSTIRLLEDDVPITEENIRELALAFVESEQGAFDFFQSLDRMEVLQELQTELGITANQAELLLSAMTAEGFDLSSLPENLRVIISELDGFSEKIQAIEVDELTSQLSSSFSEADRFGSGIMAASNATDTLSVSLLESIGFTTAQAEAISALGDEAGDTAIQLEEVTPAVDELAEAAVGVAKAFLDTKDPVESAVLSFLELRVGAGESASSIMSLIESTGLLTESELAAVDASIKLADEQEMLNQLIDAGLTTQEQAAQQIATYAEQLAVASQEVADFSSELAALTVEMIDQETVSGQLTARFIELAQESGASADQIILLASASGQLSQEELTLLGTTEMLLQKQTELLQAVADGNLTYSQASQALIAYAESIGYVGEVAEMTTRSVAQFTSGLESASGSAGGAGRQAEEAGESFRDLFVGVVSGNKDLDDLDGSVEALSSSLLDMAISSGASVDKLLSLGLATGQFSDEQAKMLLNLAIAERAIGAVADQYVAGEISAEMAAGAVESLSAQIEAGNELDLSEFGISAADLTTNATAAATAVGGATQAVSTWKDSLLEAAEAAGAKRSSLILLAEQTGNYNDSQIQAALVTEAQNLALENAATLIAAGLPVEEAIADVDAFTASLEGLSTIDLANLLDLAFEIPDLTGEELQGAVQAFVDGEGAVSVEAAVDTIFTARSGEAIEVEVVPVLSGEDQIQFDKLGGEVELEVTPVVAEGEAEITPTIDQEALTSSIREALSNLDADAEITPTIATDLLVSSIQSTLDAGEYETAVGINEGLLETAIKSAVEGTEYNLEAVVDTETIQASLASVIVDPVYGLQVMITEGEIEAQIDEETTDKVYTTTIDADLSPAEAAMNDFINRDWKVTVDVDVDSSGLPSADDGTGSNPGGGGFADGGKVPEFESGGKVPRYKGDSIPEFADGGKVSNVPAVQQGTGDLLKLATGGKLSGDSHANGGIAIEAEGGEFVVNKDSVTPLTEPLLNQINAAGDRIFGGADALMRGLQGTGVNNIPPAVVEALSSIGNTTVNLPDSLQGIASSNMGLQSMLSGMVQDPVGLAPSSTVSDNRTNIDQSSRVENTTVNNFYNGKNTNADVTPAFSFGR